MIYGGENGQLIEAVINTPSGFEYFYEKCAGLPFNSSLSPEQLLSAYIGKTCLSQSVLLITQASGELLKNCIENSQPLGHEIILIFTGELSL